MSMVVRMCGCPGETPAPPDSGVQIYSSALCCKHGADGWNSIHESTEGQYTTVPLAYCIASAVGAIHDAAVIMDDPEYLPHNNTFLFAYMRPDGVAATYAGLVVMDTHRLDLLWDPRVRRVRTFPGRAAA